MAASMTGHGHASVEQDQIRVAVEVRTVNNRFLKLSVNSDLGAEIESKVESQLKAKLARGSVSVRIKTTFLNQHQNYQLNSSAIQAYWTQLTEIAGGSQPVNVEAILQLPGVIEDAQGVDVDSVWPVVQGSLDQAIERLIQMRDTEGAAMKADMLFNIQTIESQLEQIKQRAPEVYQGYATRLTERINALLEKFNVSITASDIVKEVGIFADRVDISEETVRLTTHLQQFRKIADEPTPGKKLDFVIQEMLRETNTIGSKANNAEIARHVVEVKTAIERIREMVQNIE